MNKAGLIEIVARQTGSSKAVAERSINSVLAAMKESLKAGEPLTLAGLGNFETRTRKARKGTHPKTQQPIVIGAKRVVVFRPSDKILR